jgi:signal transduction histidine kinase/ligand-binding sensor domain-containing protein/DNA-binding response OmpR family regulator
MPAMAMAQHSDFNFINFSSKDGLSSNTVTRILKDKYGYMWFATEDGLNKFDGVNFTVYRHNVNDSTSIGANSIHALHEDRLGNLWVGTSETLSLYDRKKDCFFNYNITNKNLVRTICSDHLGNIWLGSYVGIFKLNQITHEVDRYRPAPDKPDQLMTDVVISIFEDSRKRLWIGTNAGVLLYQKNTDNFKRFLHSANDSLSIPDNVIQAIAEDSNGQLWFATNGGGFSMLRPDGKGFNNHQHKDGDSNTPSSNRVYTLTPENGGTLWIGTEEGLNILDLHTGKIVKVVNDARNKYSLRGKSVRSIFIDEYGIYWVGTYQGGVNKYDKNLAFFNLRQSNPFDPLGLNNPVVTSFAEDAHGDVYVGTDGGGINLYHRKTGLFEHPVFTAGKETKPPPVLAMERVDNELWIGTFLHGAYVLNTLNGKVKHYMEGSSAKDISSNDIFCIRKDSKGNVWLGTNGKGVNVYDPLTGVFARFDKEVSSTAVNTIPVNGFIRAIEEDKAGNIWIGSIGKGITVYHPSTRQFQLLNRENNNLATDDIQTIYMDHNGNTWVGTTRGLCLFNTKSNKFICYSEQEGLANAVIYKILEDDSGKLWVSTNKGLASFDPKSRRFKNYSYYNGLQRSTFSLGAGLKTSTGELFFGGLDGFNYFNPLALNYNKNVPSIVLTGLKISNNIIVPGENAAIKEHISITNEIRLDYKQNFSIDFVALNYTAPQESRYVYMLEGFDKTWNQVGTSQTAVFSNLRPGTYTFRVKANSDDGSWSTAERTIKIYVQPPFWLTIYAYIFYVVAAGLILWGLRYRGIRKLKNKFALEQERLQAKQTMELERRETERQREFEQVKIKYLTNLSHEFRTPVSLIVGPIERLLQQEGNPDKQGQLNLVKRNARRLLNLVNQLLDFRKLEEHELKLNLTEGDIVSFVRDVVESFKDISERKHINFTFTSSLSHFNTRFDKDKVERILFNLLSNAFKFTAKDGEIWLDIERDPATGVKIVISDTGIGMTTEVQQKIFTRFFQGDANPGTLNQGSGIGLSIIKEFAKMHGGSINVESIPGKGSTFTVQLPLELTADPIEETVESKEEYLVNGHSQQDESKATPVADMLTVLLIEDNEDFRYYLKDNLKSYYKIIEASDGKEGWQKVLSAHPQVIVSDINMPYMDGIQLSRKIKSDKRTSHIPIILLTALTGDADQLKGLETGASDYLTKPFNFEILNIKIRNLLLLNQTLKETYTRQLKVVTPDIKVESEDEKLLLKITQYIEANLNSATLSVEELSKYLFMSRGSLYSKIVNLTGETPVEFIRSIKLNKAAALLEHSDMKIAQIGYAVGFSTPNYFARAFKAKFNLLPSEYLILKRRSVN